MRTRILGIESSCDETAAAVVSDGLEVLSNAVASQIDIHKKYGGVVPELASREHLRQIVPVVREALALANMRLGEVDAIAVTQGPGLVGALLVGITYGKTLASALKKPLIPVNHLEGHVHAVFLEAHRVGREVKFPAVCLIVSGGHTVLYEVTQTRNAASENFKLLSYRKIGQTRDDAAGEAYDKVAKLLALGYPGGPILDRLAVASNAAGNGASNGAAPPVRFGPTKMRGHALDFSFSGLKTAVLYHLREHPEYAQDIGIRQAALERGDNTFEKLLPLCDGQTLALIHEFQRSVVRTLVEQTMAAAEGISAQSILVSGGVAANSELRAAFEKRAAPSGMEVFFPSRALSTDNAAMIAAAAYSRFRAGLLSDNSLNPDPALILK
ncbi:MAG TPA: tRNA (adenosine(37)-N6)-threonylcarbamoyltransferase complex transferase subunit TsaD [Candidatus Acidoferrum sp.]|nr:tRNA (adenosine(37)-N6)-threonylcarbamoyltransferase complex transferase subunit TsaD [Candidatus Acidoferrum sp.]